MTTPIGQIPPSSIPGVRTYLLAQLQAYIKEDQTSPTSSLLVCLDEPGPNQPDDIVWVGDVHQNYSPLATVGSGGSHWLVENYTVSISISIYRGGEDSAPVFARARSLADLIIAIVRSDPSLGQLVDRARPAAVTHEITWDEGHMGRHCLIDIGIEILKTL